MMTQLGHLVVLLASANVVAGWSGPSAKTMLASPRTAVTVSMRTRPATSASRRAVTVDAGNTFYKQFAAAGGGEAAIGVISIALAFLGASRRDSIYDDIKALEDGPVNQCTMTCAAPRKPLVSIARAKTLGQVSITASAPKTTAPEYADYVWLRDADTKEIIAAKKVKPGAPPEAALLTVLVAKGRRVVPLVHLSVDGVWEGDAIVAQIEAKR